MLNKDIINKMAHIYDQYIDDCYLDDYGGTFYEWLKTSSHLETLVTLFNSALDNELIRQSSITQSEEYG